MKLTGWILGLALFSAVLLGMSSFYNSLFVSYGVTDTINLTSLDKTTQINNITADIQSKIKAQSGIIEIVFTVPALLWQVLMFIFDLPGYFIGIPQEISNALVPFGFTIPIWLIGFITAVIAISLAFKIIEIISGRSGEP